MEEIISLQALSICICVCVYACAFSSLVLLTSKILTIMNRPPIVHAYKSDTPMIIFDFYMNHWLLVFWGANLYAHVHEQCGPDEDEVLLKEKLKSQLWTNLGYSGYLNMLSSGFRKVNILIVYVINSLTIHWLLGESDAKVTSIFHCHLSLQPHS